MYHPNKPLAGLSQYISRKPSRQKSTQCSRQEFLNHVQKAKPLINSFVLIKGTDKQGKPKLRICLDPKT